jgi:glycosyltransferase involved in cell wall biosynthesis
MIAILHAASVGMKVGGTEQAIRLLCRHLDRDRIANYLWAPFGGGETLDQMDREGSLAGVTFTHDACELLDFITRNQIRLALVHSGALNPLYVRPLFGALRSMPTLRVVDVAHRLRPTLGAESGLDGIVAVSAQVARLQPAAYAGRTVTIENGIELEQFVPDGALRAATRERLGIDASTPVAGYLGRLTLDKGAPDIIEAATQIARAVPSTAFLVGGDGTLRNKLEKRAATAGLGNLRFLGQVTPDARAAFYGALDVLLFPCRAESFGLVAVEACAMGLPVVAYGIPPMQDLFTDKAQAFLAPPNDVAALARLVVELLRDPGRRALAGEWNRKRSQDFSIEQTAARYENLIHDLADTDTRASSFPEKPDASLYRHAGNIAMILGDQAGVNASFSAAVAAQPSIGAAIEADVCRFNEFVERFRRAQS